MCRPLASVFRACHPLAIIAAMSFLVTFETHAQLAHEERHEVTPAWQVSLTEGEQHQSRGDGLRDAGNAQGAQRAYRLALRAYIRAKGQAPEQSQPYVYAGRVSIALRSYNEATSILSLGHARLPDNLEIRRYYGLALYLAGHKKLGVTHLEVVASQTPTADVLLILTRHYLAEGNCARAVGHIEALLKVRASREERISLARCQNALGKHQQALDAVEPLFKGGQPAPALWSIRGRAHSGLHDHRKARDDYRQYLQTLPAAHKYKAYIPLSEQLRRLGSYDGAAETARRYIRARPSSAWGYQQLGLVELSRHEWHEASNLLRQAVARAPKGAWAHALLARALRHSGDLRSALAASRKAVALSKDPGIENELGITHRKLGDTARALAIHRRLYQRHPDSRTYGLQLSHDLTQAGHHERAIAQYEQFLQRVPRHPGALKGLTVALYNLAAIKIAGADPVATTLLERVVRLSPHFCPAHVAMAALALDRQLLDVAKARLQRCRGQMPAEGHYVLGQLQLRHGQYSVAVSSLGRAAQGVGPRLEQRVRRDLAVALALAGQPDKTLDMLGQLQRRGGDPRELHQDLSLATLALAEQRLDAGQPDRAAALLKQMPLDDLPAPLRVRVQVVRALASTAANDPSGPDSLRQLARDGELATALPVALRRVGPDLLRATAALKQTRNLRRTLARLKRITARRNNNATLGKLTQAVRLATVRQLYGRGAFSAAASAGGTNAKQAAIRHDRACASYQLGKRQQAIEIFRALLDQVPEARVNLAIATEDLDGDKQRAYHQYRAYLPHARAHTPTVARWIEAKEQVLGLSE